MGVGSFVVIQRILLFFGNVDLNSVGSFNGLFRSDGYGMILLKQEFIDNMLNYVVNYYIGFEVLYVDMVFYEWNGIIMLKGVWRFYQ